MEKRMYDKFNGGDPTSVQVDVRPSMSRELLYPKKLDVTSGSVSIKMSASILGADEVEILVGNDAPAVTLTLKFYAGKYQMGSDVTLTTNVGTADKLTVNTVSFSDLIYCDTVKITSTSFTGGDFELWLGKKGLS